MPQQKRKASAIASAKIAEEAGVGRKRKSDAKEEQRSSAKETNDDNKDEIEQTDDKPVDEAPDNKRRKKKQSNVQEIQAQQQGNGANGNNEPQGHDLINPQEHDQMLIDDYNKNADPKKELSQTANEEQNKVETKELKELEKKMAPNTLEKGHVCFLYKPKVGTEEADDNEDVQSLHMVLVPFMVRPSVSEEPIDSYSRLVIENKLSDSDKPIPGKVRIIFVGKKKLPNIEKDTKLWAHVDKTFTNSDDIKEFVTGKKYQTKTRGEKSVSASRLLARGVYNVVEHEGHTHLAYVLEFPEESSDVQSVFNIEQEGSFVINIKNPKATNPSNAGLPDSEKVEYPTHLLEKFGDRRFVSLSTSEFLDHDGAEVLLIGTKETGEELEELAEFEKKKITPLADATYVELHLEKEILPSEPLQDLWKYD